MHCLRSIAKHAKGTRALRCCVGEAGVGKTRLLHELATHAARSSSCVGTGVAFPFACPPFAPLREALASLHLPDVFESDEQRPSTPDAPEGKYQRFVAAARTLQAPVKPSRSC
jgi:predicted ATPase